MNEQIKKEIVDFMSWALDNNSDDFHITTGFHGHVNHLKIEVYFGGWKEGKKPDIHESMFFNTSSTLEDLKKVIAEVKAFK